jgi:hypothetical protein
VNQEGRLTYQEFKMWITKNQWYIIVTGIDAGLLTLLLTGCFHHYYAIASSLTECSCSIMDYIESIFPYGGPKDIQPHKNRKETLPHMKR